uniref:Uncharacterized protein n=1 Tax=Arundo donax TaxID=35708 RepID=A0A0A9DKY8_ARUDO
MNFGGELKRLQHRRKSMQSWSQEAGQETVDKTASRLLDVSASNGSTPTAAPL